MSERFKRSWGGSPWQADARTDEELALLELQNEISTNPAFEFIADYLQKAKAFGLDITDFSVILRAIDAGTVDFHAAEAKAYMGLNLSQPPSRGRRSRMHPPVVYYARRGRLIKIGTTRNLASRMSEVGAAGALAIEPGGLDRERQRHRQFKALHDHLEWFTLGEALGAHIADIRQRFEAYVGHSVDDWIAAQASSRAWHGTRTTPLVGQDQLALPPKRRASTRFGPDLVPASEVARIHDVTPSAVYFWRTSGRLRPAARTPGGRMLYRVSDVLAIRPSHATKPKPSE